ncbi:hypothetical protein [Hoeflea sp. TYP-13]|uniref:hypothetical protein n=1 Tax=Hoeflea sp. TYP-13 TaxID=3230023 RepID=UPI0034C6B22A
MTETYRSLSTGKAQGQRRDAEALNELQGAYERLFFGRGHTPEDQQMVLADLASFTGFFFSQDQNTPAETLREANAMRRVFARIIRLGLGADGDLSALYRAAVAETLATKEEGKTL